jgi:hypothetical protein
MSKANPERFSINLLQQNAATKHLAFRSGGLEAFLLALIAAGARKD